jgi:hypothetical protein
MYQFLCQIAINSKIFLTLARLTIEHRYFLFMNKENPHLLELKIRTVRAIQDIMHEQYLSQTDACRYFFPLEQIKK